jgi:hypothetical protein
MSVSRSLSGSQQSEKGRDTNLRPVNGLTIFIIGMTKAGMPSRQRAKYTGSNPYVSFNTAAHAEE